MTTHQTVWKVVARDKERNQAEAIVYDLKVMGIGLEGVTYKTKDDDDGTGQITQAYLFSCPIPALISLERLNSDYVESVGHHAVQELLWAGWDKKPVEA